MINLTAVGVQKAEVQLPKTVLVLYKRSWVTIVSETFAPGEDALDLGCGGLMVDGSSTRRVYSTKKCAEPAVVDPHCHLPIVGHFLLECRFTCIK